jgi:hypothetical protein
MCERHLLSRQNFLKAALALAASPLLRYVPAHAADQAEVSEIAPGFPSATPGSCSISIT